MWQFCIPMVAFSISLSICHQLSSVSYQTCPQASWNTLDQYMPSDSKSKIWLTAQHSCENLLLYLVWSWRCLEQDAEYPSSGKRLPSHQIQESDWQYFFPKRKWQHFSRKLQIKLVFYHYMKEKHPSIYVFTSFKI